MKLVEFLIYLLEAHAQTLQRLAALFGEEVLFELLESAGEKRDDEAMAARDRGDEKALAAIRTPGMPDPALFEPAIDDGSDPYAEIEGAVQAMKLPEILEFHLWAYPHYRAVIEGPVPLDARIPRAGAEAGTRLVNEAVAQAEAWVRQLPLPPGPLATRAERAASVPWLRFRTEALKRIGKRPLGPVY